MSTEKHVFNYTLTMKKDSAIFTGEITFKEESESNILLNSALVVGGQLSNYVNDNWLEEWLISALFEREYEGNFSVYHNPSPITDGYNVSESNGMVFETDADNIFTVDYKLKEEEIID